MRVGGRERGRDEFVKKYIQSNIYGDAIIVQNNQLSVFFNAYKQGTLLGMKKPLKSFHCGGMISFAPLQESLGPPGGPGEEGGGVLGPFTISKVLSTKQN